MRYANWILALLITFSGNALFAQTPPVPEIKLPEILPPSPDVAAFMKGGQLSTNMHTGAANASIPVYEIKMKGYSFPVSINYSANGYKPQENPSRTGIGWSLSAGGAVTRVIRGKPDEHCTTPTPLTYSQITNYSATALNYVNDLENQESYHDAQPDEYNYSVNGLSGKFIIDRNGNVLQLPYNKVKIIVETGYPDGVNTITITDESGVKYIFGIWGSDHNYEKTLEHNLVNNMLQKQVLRTGWMLSRIIFPNDEWISFSYSSVTNRAETGNINTVQRRLFNSSTCDPTPPCSIAEGWPLGPPRYCPVDVTYTSKTQIVKYYSKAINNISTSTGVVINFTYEDREDIGGDLLLRNIYILSNAVTIKHMQLEYAYTPGYQPTVDLNSKFFLKKAIIKDPTGGSAPSQEFVLKYVDNGVAFEVPAGWPDHLGFATNGVSSTPMPALTEEELLFENDIVNKNPNGNISKIGMLQRITYPTEGYDEFHYEPNMKTWWDSVDKKNIVNARASGVGASNPFNYYTVNFTPGRSCSAEFYLKATWDGTGSEPSGDPAPKTAYAHLYVNATNELVAMRRVEGHLTGLGYIVYGDLNILGGLTGGVEYRLELEVRYGSNVSAQADIVYDAGNTKEWKKLNEELCGVRVRKIDSYDPVSRKTISKFFSYFDITDTTKASANKLYYPDYITEGQSAMWCECWYTYSVTCNSKIYSTNSSASMFLNQAGGVTYTSVIESDDSLFANGGIQHNFFTQGALAGGVVLGMEIPDRPAELYDFRNGRDTQTIYFNKDRAIVRKTKSYYSYDSRISQVQDLNYIFRKRYEPNPVIYPVTQQSFLQLDVMEYRIESKWDHIDSTVTWEYDLVNNKVLKTKTSFNYATTAVVQPSAVISKMSDGSETKKEMKYPTDLVAQAVCSTMVAKNIVNPVMEEKTFKDSKLLYQTNTEYKDWFNNATILAPELVKNQKNTNSQETRIRYYQYDSKGNPLELSKENDVHITYIWDYNGTLPIAEVTNASWGFGVAYSSFEADGKGGWSFSGTPATEGTEPAGKKSYPLSAGNITYPGTLAGGKKYYITYWAKDGAALVNGTAGTSLLTKNYWTLYKRTLTYSGSGGITVSGSGYIDELRLYPDSSFMKTFTYTPEVGTTTAADNNSLYQQYEYDVFNRLLRIRDMDRNILKQYEYKYGGDVTGCTNTTANWQATGNYRCAKNNYINNNNTGIKEQEELDLNNCSETYGQTRWVSIGTSAECPVISNCSGVNKRVINGVCYTGCKQLLSSVYIGNLQWSCTFRYYWEQDGFTGPEFTETHTSYCIGTTCGL